MNMTKKICFSKKVLENEIQQFDIPENSNSEIEVIDLNDDSDVYEVESIEDKIVNAMYLIKWRNFDESHYSWEPIENCTNCLDLIEQIEASLNTVIENEVIEIYDNADVEMNQFNEITEDHVFEENLIQIHFGSRNQ